MNPSREERAKQKRNFWEVCLAQDAEKLRQLHGEHPWVFTAKCFEELIREKHVSAALWLWEQAKEYGLSLDFSYAHDLLFLYMCREGRLAEIQRLIASGMSINLTTRNHTAFQWACQDGNLELAQWLHQQTSSLIPMDRYSECYSQALWKGHLPMVRWLVSIAPACSDLCAEDLTLLFHKFCGQGRWDRVQWLWWRSKDSIDLGPFETRKVKKDYIEHAFSGACRQGHLEIVQWLDQIGCQYDVSQQEDYLFFQVCQNGHLAVAQWLLERFPQIDLRAYHSRAFSQACEHGHLPVVEWLYQVVVIEREQKFSLSGRGDSAFLYTSSNGHLVTAQWMWKHAPIYDQPLDINQVFRYRGIRDYPADVRAWHHEVYNALYPPKK